jgi:hypothetical protein
MESPPIALAIKKLADAHQVKLVLVGAHAANRYTGKPRHTADVDFIADKPKRLLELIRRSMPEIQIKEFHAVNRLYKDGEQVADIINPNTDLMRAALQGNEEFEGFLVPTLEVMAALKYASMISPNRARPDKRQDAADFSRIILNNQRLLDASKISGLVRSVYEGADRDVLRLIDDVLNDRPMTI